MCSSLRAATLGLILAAAVVAIISLPAQASDPEAATWELNLAKSTFTNVPPPKSQTRTYEVTGQLVKMTGKGIDAQGKPTLIGFTANKDGKDYPYTASAAYDTISLTPVDASTVNWTNKKAGKVVITGTRVISKDGKVMTISGKGTNPKENPWRLSWSLTSASRPGSSEEADRPPSTAMEPLTPSRRERRGSSRTR